MLLVDEGLMSARDVEQALDEQRRTGRLLGEIVVQRGYVSGVALARALAKQHSVELRPASGVEPPAAPPSGEPDSPQAAAARVTWRPLGRVLVENGFVSARTLREGLQAQADEPHRRLGEVPRGTGSDLRAGGSRSRWPSSTASPSTATIWIATWKR